MLDEFSALLTKVFVKGVAAKIPTPRPITAAKTVSTKLSATNCVTMVLFLAPMAFSTPISFLLSRTIISMARKTITAAATPQAITEMVEVVLMLDKESKVVCACDSSLVTSARALPDESLPSAEVIADTAALVLVTLSTVAVIELIVPVWLLSFCTVDKGMITAEPTDKFRPIRTMVWPLEFVLELLLLSLSLGLVKIPLTVIVAPYKVKVEPTFKLFCVASWSPIIATLSEEFPSIVAPELKLTLLPRFVIVVATSVVPVMEIGIWKLELSEALELSEFELFESEVEESELDELLF